MASTSFSVPAFEEVLVENDLKDGYWIAPVDVNGDGKPDLVAPVWPSARSSGTRIRAGKSTAS